MREVRAATAITAVAVEAADGVGDDDADVRAMGSTARAWRGEGVQLRQDTESSPDLVLAVAALTPTQIRTWQWQRPLHWG